jgi:hypothetical protein
VLALGAYLLRWSDTFHLCEGDHLRIADVLKCVDLIAWDNLRPGNGYRTRRRGDYLLVLQKPPIVAKSTWRDHGIASRWPEKVDRKIHPHVKPIGLITRLIRAVTQPGDLVVDPAAGSFVVMRAAHQLGRDIIGCDLKLPENGTRAIGGVATTLQRRFAVGSPKAMTGNVMPTRRELPRHLREPMITEVAIGGASMMRMEILF